MRGQGRRERGPPGVVHWAVRQGRPEGRRVLLSRAWEISSCSSALLLSAAAAAVWLFASSEGSRAGERGAPRHLIWWTSMSMACFLFESFIVYFPFLF